MAILAWLKGIAWGTPTLALLLAFGVYFTFKSRFFCPRRFLGIFRDTLGRARGRSNGGISVFASAATALGGTVGAGSIIGVGLALEIGGAGSIFWMLVCSFFGMGLKYAEIKIALGNRKLLDGKRLGGAHIALFGLGYKRLAYVFCLLCILTSFATGNLTQIGAMSGFMLSSGAPVAITALACFSVVAAAVFGGRRRIAKINSVIVPIGSLIYLGVCAVLLFINREYIFSALCEIFKGAFGLTAFGGGIGGAVIARAFREGFARSIFSNEAGMGSSPLAYASANEATPENEAKWGVFEVFFDSFIVSGITALCLLTGGYTDVSLMFSSLLGRVGNWVYGALTAVFAFASVISWCYYAECCLDFLFKRSKKPFFIYRMLFSLAAMLGVFVSGETVWELADVLNALMMMPNIFLLFKCRKEIERIE